MQFCAYNKLQTSFSISQYCYGSYILDLYYEVIKRARDSIHDWT